MAVVDHSEIICPQEKHIVGLTVEVNNLKGGQAEVKEELKDMRHDVGEIKGDTAEIKAILNNNKKSNGSVQIKWLIISVVILASIIAVILGVPIPV